MGLSPNHQKIRILLVSNSPEEVWNLPLCVGRELEQAAAHTLATEGGVAQDTPETITSQDALLTDKLFSPPLPSQPRPSPLAPAEAAEKAAGPPAAEISQQQTTAALPMESIAEEEPSRTPAGSTPAADNLTTAQAEGPGGMEPEDREVPPVESQEEVKLFEEREAVVAANAEGEMTTEKQKVRPRKAAAILEEQQPVRASKRSKPPAPWR